MASISSVANFSMIDEAIAARYANDAISQMVCEDADVVKKFCKNRSCLKWKRDPKRQLWTRPLNFSTVKCNTEADCKGVDTFFQPHCILNPETNQKLCAYDPKFFGGTCQIATPEKCGEYSKTPYVCDENNMNCELGENTQYWEWHPTEKIKCDEKAPCFSRNSKCNADGTCTCTNDDECGGTAKCVNGVCTGGGRCVYGNYLLRQWCENPKSRCQANEDGSYPEECAGGPNARGVTDVPPYAYDTSSGKCFITQPYCENFDRDFNGRRCSRNSQCRPDEICHAGYCTGPDSKCVKRPTDIVLEMTVGRTTGRIFSKVFGADGLKDLFTDPVAWGKRWSCDKFAAELFDEMRSWLDDSIKNMPPRIEVLVDPRLVRQKEIVSMSYIEGIPLYFLVWGIGAKNRTPTLGFLSTHLQSRFPHLLHPHDDENGMLYLHMKWADLRKEDTVLKRLYVVSAHGAKFSSTMVQYITSRLTPDERENLERIIKSYESSGPSTHNFFA